MKFKIVVTGDMIEERYFNNSLFISNTQLISNERSITERIIYNIPLVWVGFVLWFVLEYSKSNSRHVYKLFKKLDDKIYWFCKVLSEGHFRSFYAILEKSNGPIKNLQKMWDKFP